MTIRIVISQPMYFPWVGMLEQIRLSNIFVFYDDVQFARGFFNRVQIKTEATSRFLSVPLRDRHRGQLLNEIQVDNRKNWQKSHYDRLRQNYKNTPYKNEMLDVFDSVVCAKHRCLSGLSAASTLALMRYFSLNDKIEVDLSSSLNITGRGSQRLLDICRHYNANVYITGHGAKNYLNHEIFEESGVGVSYISYGMKPYQQPGGVFNPYVSALDLIANCGRKGINYISGSLVPWRDFLYEQSADR